MRKILLLAILLQLKLVSIAQYKVKGFIINSNKDTVHGTILLDESRGVANYRDLAKKLNFTDSTGIPTTFAPGEIEGFGLRDGTSREDYVSVSLKEKEKPQFFLKKIVAGKISLYERRVLMDNPPNVAYTGNRTVMLRERRPEGMMYYLKDSSGLLIKFETTSQASLIKKRRLKEKMNFFPEDFANSNEQIGLSELVGLLEKYNAE
jgi:hypothetical protein